MANMSYPMSQRDFQAIAESLGAAYRHPFGDRGAVYYAFEFGGVIVVTDNGGEVTVYGLNRVLSIPSIPTNEPGTDRQCGPLTAGYRIRCKMLGDAVDYSRNIDAEVAA